MALTRRTRSDTVDDLYISIFQKAKAGLIDNFFDPKKSNTLSMLRAKGGFLPQKGGDFIKRDVEVAENDQIFYLEKGSEIDYVDYEFMEEVRYTWRYMAKPIVRFGIDDQQNRGESTLVDMIVAKIKNTMKSYDQLVDSLVFADNGSSTTIPHGLQHLIADDPTASVSVGELNQSTYSYWRNYYLDFTSTYGSTDNDWINNGVTAMRTAINSVVGSGIDLIITSQHIFELMQDDLLQYYQWTGNSPADLGLPTSTPSFQGIPVIWSKNIGNRMYFLDLDTFNFVYDPAYFFEMSKWHDIPRQPGDRAAYIRLTANFICSARRANGVLFNLPA